jgi:hypothetical protein
LDNECTRSRRCNITANIVVDLELWRILSKNGRRCAYFSFLHLSRFHLRVDHLIAIAFARQLRIHIIHYNHLIWKSFGRDSDDRNLTRFKLMSLAIFQIIFHFETNKISRSCDFTNHSVRSFEWIGQFRFELNWFFTWPVRSVFSSCFQWFFHILQQTLNDFACDSIIKHYLLSAAGFLWCIILQDVVSSTETPFWINSNLQESWKLRWVVRSIFHDRLDKLNSRDTLESQAVNWQTIRFLWRNVTISHRSWQ